MKYCVTLLLREFDTKNPYPDFVSKYYVAYTVCDLNNWLFQNICNTYANSEIISLYFEVVKE